MQRVAFVALVVFVLLMGIDWPPPPIPGHAEWADLAMPVAVVALAVALVTRRLRWPVGAGVTCSALAYLGCALASALVHRSGYWKVVGLVELACVMVVTAALTQNERHRDRLLRAWIVGAAVLSLVSLVGAGLALAHVPSVLYDPRGGDLNLPLRARGLCVTSNLLASQLLVPLLLLAFDRRRWLGRAGAIVLALVAMAFVVTISRSWLAAALAATLFALDGWRRATLVALLALALLASARLDLYRAANGSVTVSTTPGLRWRLGTSALRSAVERPWVGVGPDGAPAHVEWPRPGDPLADMAAHDTPIGIAATLGFPALLAFVALCWFVFRSAALQQGDAIDRLLVCALVATLFDGLTMDVENFRHLWLLFGLVVAKREADPTTAS